MARSNLVLAPPAWHRELRTVGVTGTNGKTTTASWIAAALGSLGAPALCVTTLGVSRERAVLAPLADYPSFLEAMRAHLDRGGRHAAVEVTSEALAAGFARAWPSDVAVFTNLSHDHLDSHGSAEHYLASKAQLFAALPEGGVAVLNGCDGASRLLCEIVPRHARVVSYGSSDRGVAVLPLDVEIRDVCVSRAGTSLTLDGHTLGGRRVTTLRGIGAVFAENAAAALLGAVSAGVSVESALDAVSRAPMPPGRFEVVAQAPLVVVDYAHTPDAVARTCATARALADADGGRLAVVFGAGGDRDRAKREPMGRASAISDRVVLTTDNPRSEDPREIAAAIARGLVGHPAVRVELDRRRAIETAIGDAGEKDVILVLGRGHERAQIMESGREIAFSDVEVATEAATARYFA